MDWAVFFHPTKNVRLLFEIFDSILKVATDDKDKLQRFIPKHRCENRQYVHKWSIILSWKIVAVVKQIYSV